MSIHSLLGDNEQKLLDLEPEDLAYHVLVDLQQQDEKKRGELNLHNYTNIGSISDDVRFAVGEAWAHLVREGLIAHFRDNMFFLTRRGRSIKTTGDYEKHLAAKYPQDILHPAIHQKAYPQFIRGDYDTAVFLSFRQVEIQVRHNAKMDNSKHGQKLLRAALNCKTGVLRGRDLSDQEQSELENLFVSAYGYFRNPLGHRELFIDDPVLAIEMIMIASHLAKIVDELEKPS